MVWSFCWASSVGGVSFCVLVTSHLFFGLCAAGEDGTPPPQARELQA